LNILDLDMTTYMPMKDLDMHIMVDATNVKCTKQFDIRQQLHIAEKKI